MKPERIPPPCEHMKPTLNKAADGSLKGPSKWMMLFHLLHCTGCRRFLMNLQELVQNLRHRREKEVEPEAMERLKKVVREQGNKGIRE